MDSRKKKFKIGSIFERPNWGQVEDRAEHMCLSVCTCVCPSVLDYKLRNEAKVGALTTELYCVSQ